MRLKMGRRSVLDSSDSMASLVRSCPLDDAKTAGGVGLDDSRLSKSKSEASESTGDGGDDKPGRQTPMERRPSKRSSPGDAGDDSSLRQSSTSSILLA